MTALRPSRAAADDPATVDEPAAEVGLPPVGPSVATADTAGAASRDGGPARTRRGPFRSLAVRNYRLYFFGQLISLTGTWAQWIAQDWLVLQLTNSGTVLGIVTALQFAPSLLLSLYGGALADRGDKRKLMLGTQSGLGLAALVLGVLDLTGVVALWHVLVLAAIVGVFSALDAPIRQAFVVEMVGPDDLPNAVALNSTSFNLARIAGPAIAGLVITAFGTSWAFLGNAVSSLAVLAGLSLMRPADLLVSKPVRREPGQYRAAVRYVRTRSDLVLPMLLMFVIGTFGMNFQISIALVAKQVFHRGADSYGLLSTMLAIGATLGALGATTRRSRPTRLFLVGAALAFSVTEMLAGLMPSYALTALALIPAGFTMITMAQSANATVQLGVDPSMRGRVMGLYILCFMGGTPIGAPIVGWVAELLGPRWAMLGGGMICLVMTLLVAGYLSRRRQVGSTQVMDRLRSPHPFPR
ncbi:MFS transporter [Jatrophihabitans sp.]|uniref:MFS transporter n=1 Tax=Jatrophihabitans sp. TaxID=1932789 RepID=UPI002C7B764B|nr:MFS transporter [Jatrophihabitans sp.]